MVVLQENRHQNTMMKRSNNGKGDDSDLGKPLSIHERADPSRAVCTTKRGRRSWRKFANVTTKFKESSPRSKGGRPPTSPFGNSSNGGVSYAKLVPFTASSSTCTRNSKFDDNDSRALSIEERKCPSISVCSTRPGPVGIAIGRRRKNTAWRVLSDYMNKSDSTNKEKPRATLVTDIRDSDEVPLVLDTTQLSDSRNDREEISALGDTVIGEQEEKGEEEEPADGTILMSSYNYYLLSGNRQITYYEYSGRMNAYQCMKIINYDFFPVFVGSDRCLIKVLSSSVSYFDCIIRQGEWHGDIQPHPHVPGFDAVGEVMATGPDANFEVGDKVATVLRRGGNSRFAVAANLVKIDTGENVHHVCGILSTYVAAFQMLHTGDEESREGPDRYFHGYFRGKVVFVNGGMSGFGQAVIHLANMFGAQKVYATSRPKDFDHLRDLGSTPLPLGSVNAMKNLVNAVDLVIDMTTYASNDNEMYDHLSAMRKAITGKLVFNVHGDIAKNGRHGIRTSYELLQLRSKFLLLSNVYLCDHLDPSLRRTFFKNDFAFLRRLARLRGKNRLHVKVVATLSLDEVPHAHYKLGNSNVRGVITCDPWL